MGPYTEVNCAFSLKRHTPEEVIDALLFMTGQDDQEPKQLPSHALFKTQRWREILNGIHSAAESEAYCNAAVELSDGSGRYRVTIRCDLQNCDNEIGQFVSWITPYIHAHKGDFIGYIRSKELEPLTLLLYPDRTFTKQLPDEVEGEPV
jgi:hypothetical protein